MKIYETLYKRNLETSLLLSAFLLVKFLQFAITTYKKKFFFQKGSEKKEVVEIQTRSVENICKEVHARPLPLY